jgi:FKBP-type peptidyl-prolyl cis-trans isomerase
MGVVLAACGSSTPSSTTSTAAGSPTASGPTTTGSSTALPATTAGPTPSGLAAANPPAVAGATDVKVEPVIGPGSAPPPTSLETKDLVVGTGPAAVASSTVDVFYVGANYTTGKVFDDTPWREHQATPFPLSGVVPGFGQGIVGMKVGGRREIVIPPALGYGATGDSPAVSPNETLVFVVDLTSVK